MRRSFEQLFELSESIINHALDNNKDDVFLTKNDLESTKILVYLTQVKEDDKFQLYFPSLFRHSLYNKNTKYLFLWGHLKLYKYIVKNKLELWLGENVNEEKKNLLNTKFPLYKIFAYANSIKLAHEIKIERNNTVYTQKDDDFTLIFKLFEAIYDVLFYLEKKTDKKNMLREIRDWSRRTVTGEPEEEEEMDIKAITQKAIAQAKKMDIRALVNSYGVKIPDDVNIEDMLEKAFSDDGDGSDIISKMTSGDMSFLNEGFEELGNPDLEEVEEEIYEEIDSD